MQPADSSDPAKLEKLVAAAECSCVVLQTLRSGVQMHTHFDILGNEQYATKRSEDSR
jgi:hypothetical protein